MNFPDPITRTQKAEMIDIKVVIFVAWPKRNGCKLLQKRQNKSNPKNT